VLKHRAKVHKSQIVEGNKRRVFNDDPAFKRWVGSSINFEEPKIDKVAVKMSKKTSL